MADTAHNSDSEVWKDIPEWDGYQASSLGRIRALDRVRVQLMRDGSMQPVLYPARIRSQSKCPQTGYMKVGLSNVGKRRTCNVNVLVCSAFHGPRPEKYDSAHWNGDRTDNRAANLRWASRSENLSDRQRHGTLNSGERNGQAKVSNAQIAEIVRRHGEGELMKDLAMEFGVRATSLYQRISGRRRKSV